MTATLQPLLVGAKDLSLREVRRKFNLLVESGTVPRTRLRDLNDQVFISNYVLETRCYKCTERKV